MGAAYVTMICALDYCIENDLCTAMANLVSNVIHKCVIIAIIIVFGIFFTVVWWMLTGVRFDSGPQQNAQELNFTFEFFKRELFLIHVLFPEWRCSV